MTTQPEALRLADLLITDAYWSPMLGEQAAAELRRLYAAREECERQYQVKCDEIGALHEVNQELLEALEEAIELFVVASTGGGVNFWMAAKDLRKIHNKATGYEE